MRGGRPPFPASMCPTWLSVHATTRGAIQAGNYYGNDRLANLVPQIVFDDYVLPAVDTQPRHSLKHL